VVIIAGSVSEVTAKQISRAEKSLKTKVIEVNMYQVFTGKVGKDLEISRVVREVKEALDERRDVVIRWAESQRSAEETKKSGRSMGLGDDEIRKQILEVLGEISLAIVNSVEVGGMVLTGGDTAFAVYKALNIHETKVEKEVLPGIPALRFIRGKADEIRVVTKAGAFGDENALVTAIEYLRERT